MRYHYEKPSIYLSMYGASYSCSHPVYSKCTLFKINDKGLAVIQQRYDPDTKKTWWGELDPWLTDDLYLHPRFKKFLTIVLVSVGMGYIQPSQFGKLCGR